MMTEIEAKRIISNVLLKEREKYFTSTLVYKELSEALEMAIKALEKQIPKKPLTEYHCVLQRLCPSCGCEVSDIEYRKWSCNCGQKLDWE